MCLVCVASHVRVGGTREEAIILISFSENGPSVSTVLLIGILINIWTTSIIHYKEILIALWKYGVLFQFVSANCVPKICTVRNTDGVHQYSVYITALSQFILKFF